MIIPSSFIIIHSLTWTLWGWWTVCRCYLGTASSILRRLFIRNKSLFSSLSTTFSISGQRVSELYALVQLHRVVIGGCCDWCLGESQTTGSCANAILGFMTVDSSGMSEVTSPQDAVRSVASATIVPDTPSQSSKFTHSFQAAEDNAGSLA